jgi:splicing factor 3B subunit 3
VFSKLVSSLLPQNSATSKFKSLSKCIILTCAFFISYLYQIAHLGDDDDEPEFSSAMPLEEGDTFFFAPRALRNLVLVDEIEALSPILACQVADLGTFSVKLIKILLTHINTPSK